MSNEHPARLAGHKSMDIVQNRGENAKERWLALFADDAIVEDPIGPSPLDPKGKGHRGKEAIAKFWDLAIANTEIRFDIERSYACGHEVANVGTISTKMAGGMAFAVPGVFTYRVNDEGKILALRAFWEFDKLAASMGG